MTKTEMLQRMIDESGLKRNAILEMMGFKAYSTLREKVENRREFTASEITRLCEILNLTNDQREVIFFTKSVESYSA